MNNFTAITVVAWESRNWRHRDKAAVLCQNYGLVQVLKNSYSGKLYALERKALAKEFEKLFIKKTERYSLLTVCRTCFESSSFSATLEKDIKNCMHEEPAFEIIQLDTLGENSKLKPKEP